MRIGRISEDDAFGVELKTCCFNLTTHRGGLDTVQGVCDIGRGSGFCHVVEHDVNPAGL